MIIHRKANHPNIIRKCSNFRQNKCIFMSSSCWYSYEEEAMETDEIKTNNDENNVKQNVEKNNDTETVFQKVFQNLKPPINKEKKN